MVKVHKFFRRVRRIIEIGRSLCYLDIGSSNQCIILTGFARSGTTWLGNTLQQATGYRSIFEPYFPFYVSKSISVGYFPYANKNTNWPTLESFTQKVIQGRLRGKWVDRDNRRFVFKGRIIKEIRINFMLGWLRKRYPMIPIILLVRNPLDVFVSWSYLGWLNGKPEEHFAMQRLLFDQRFNEAYPDVVHFMKKQQFVTASFTQFIYDWYLSYAVPLNELTQKDFLLVGYEELKENFDCEMERILNYTRICSDMDLLSNASSYRSSTDFGVKRSNKTEIQSKILEQLKQSGEWQQADALLKQLSGSGLEDYANSSCSVLRSSELKLSA